MTDNEFQTKMRALECALVSAYYVAEALSLSEDDWNDLLGKVGVHGGWGSQSDQDVITMVDRTRIGGLTLQIHKDIAKLVELVKANQWPSS